MHLMPGSGYYGTNCRFSNRNRAGNPDGPVASFATLCNVTSSTHVYSKTTPNSAKMATSSRVTTRLKTAEVYGRFVHRRQHAGSGSPRPTLNFVVSHPAKARTRAFHTQKFAKFAALTSGSSQRNANSQATRIRRASINIHTRDHNHAAATEQLLPTKESSGAISVCISIRIR